MKKIIILFLNKLNKSIFGNTFLINYFLVQSLKNNTNYAKGTLLDIGSGAAPYKKYFIDKVFKYLTLDRIDTTASIPIKPDIEGDIINIPLETNSIDTILCTQVLEHVNEPEKALSEMFRVLNYEGIAYISIPLIYNIHMEHDYFRYTYKGMNYLSEKVGFKVEKIIPNGYFFTGFYSYLHNYIHSLFMINKFTKFLFILCIPFIFIFQFINNILGFILESLLPKNINYSSNYLFILKKTKN